MAKVATSVTLALPEAASATLASLSRPRAAVARPLERRGGWKTELLFCETTAETPPGGVALKAVEMLGDWVAIVANAAAAAMGRRHCRDCGP